MRTSDQIDDQFGTTDTVSKINDSRDQIRNESPQTVDWAKALQEQQMRNINMNNEYREIMYRDNYDRLQNEAKRQDSIEKAIAATDPSTGRLSPGQLKLLNENRGVVPDGKGFQDGQIVEGGYIGNTGDYGFVIAHPGSDGNVSYERRRFSRGDLYGMMSNRPDLFLPQDVEAAGLALQKADTSYVPEGRLAELTAKYKAKIGRRNADMESIRNSMFLDRRLGTAGNGLSVDDRLRLQQQKHGFTMDEIGARGQSQLGVAKENGQTRRAVAGMNNESRERIALQNNETRMSIADLTAGLRKMGFDISEKELEEKQRHNKATEAATAGRDAETGRHHKATEGAATARAEERTRHNKATEEVQQQRADTQAQRVEDQYELGDRKQTHNENRLENDKAQKEADRQLKREWMELKARKEKLGKSGKSMPDVDLNRLLKLQRLYEGTGLTAETRNKLRDELNGNGGDKATIKRGDNTHDEGTQEPPNGEYHTVKDGVSYHWGKSKSGKYGYFPDK